MNKKTKKVLATGKKIEVIPLVSFPEVMAAVRAADGDVAKAIKDGKVQ